MKMKREMPLSEALDDIADRVQRLKSEGAARVNGYEVKLDEPVVLEIESEAEKGIAELEFEIKWQAGKKARRGRRLLLGAAAGAAVGAAPLTVIRRRRQQGDDEYES
jgi:hypothetical protein